VVILATFTVGAASGAFVTLATTGDETPVTRRPTLRQADGRPLSPQQSADRTFVGVVRNADLADDWAHTRLPAFAYGSEAGRRFTVGPATVVLANGRRLRVPYDTPGGNMCIEFLSRDMALLGDEWVNATHVPAPTRERVRKSMGQGTRPCVVVGQTDGKGAVAWFMVARERRDPDLVAVGPIVRTAGRLVVTSIGATFPVDPRAKVECGPFADTVEEVAQEDLSDTAFVSVSSSRVAYVQCRFEA
jgi:hypothetical protein